MTQIRGCLQVEQVLLAKSSSISRGTIHLTAHHIIFRYQDEDEKEMWVSDVVHLCLIVLKKSAIDTIPIDITGQSSSTRSTGTIPAQFSYTNVWNVLSDFQKGFWGKRCLRECEGAHCGQWVISPIALAFLSLEAASVSHLYAFFYSPKPPFPSTEGWTLYSPREEYGRMGVGSRSKAWRFTDLNKDYTVCFSPHLHAIGSHFSVLSYLPITFGRTYKNKRCHPSIRLQVPE